MTRLIESDPKLTPSDAQTAARTVSEHALVSRLAVSPERSRRKLVVVVGRLFLRHLAGHQFLSHLDVVVFLRQGEGRLRPLSQNQGLCATFQTSAYRTLMRSHLQSLR